MEVRSLYSNLPQDLHEEVDSFALCLPSFRYYKALFLERNKHKLARRTSEYKYHTFMYTGCLLTLGKKKWTK